MDSVLYFSFFPMKLFSEEQVELLMECVRRAVGKQKESTTRETATGISLTLQGLDTRR